MRIIDKAKEFAGMGSGEEESEFEVDDEEEEEFEEDFETEEEVEEEEEPEPEWDTAYRMVDDVVQERGFSGTKEVILKAASKTIRESGLYRDRISSGKETIEQVSSAVDTLESVGSSGDEPVTDFGKEAERLAEANQLIEQVDEFSNSEEMIARRAMNIVDKGVEAYKGSKEGKGSGGGGVETRTTESDRRI